MKIHGRGFQQTKPAYEFLMSHLQNPVKDCVVCYPPQPILEKSMRKNKSKRKGMDADLRAKVYKRSNFMCEDCQISEGKAIHHIKSVYEYPELQFEFDNLIHLCLQCHANRHTNMNPILFLDNHFITKNTKRNDFRGY